MKRDENRNKVARLSEKRFIASVRRNALAKPDKSIQKKPAMDVFLWKQGKSKADYNYITVNTIQTVIVVLKQNQASVTVLRA